MPRVKSNKRAIDLLPPMGGLSKGMSYQNAPPYTSVSCLNVLPRAPWGERRLIAQRPGASKELYTQLGSGVPVRMMATCDVVRSDGLTQFNDSFSGTALGSVYIDPPPGDATDRPALDTSFKLIYRAIGLGGQGVGYIDGSTLSPPIDTARDVDMALWLVPIAGVWANGGGTPLITISGLGGEWSNNFQGFKFNLTLTTATGAYTSALAVYRNDAVDPVVDNYAGASGNLSSVKPGWFRVVYTQSTRNLKAYWQGVLLVNQNMTAPTDPPSGEAYWGFELQAGGGYIGNMLLQYYATVGTTGIAPRPRSLLLASAGGVLYREAKIGTWEALGGNYTLGADRYLPAVDYLQKLYILDNSDVKATVTNGTCNAGGTVLDSATYTDWTTIGINAYDYICTITGSTGGTAVTPGDYPIAAVAAGTFTIASTCGGDATTTGISFTIRRGPKRYSESTGLLELWTPTTGRIPIGATVLCNYQQRAFMADQSGGCFLSRKGDFLDWNYSADATDPFRAYNFTEQAASAIGKPVVAAFPVQYGYMVMAATNSLFVLRGDPAAGGLIERISDNVGCISNSAGCLSSDGALYFLSGEGLCMLPPMENGFARPDLISRKHIPDDLRDIDVQITQVSMVYDDRLKGIWIILADSEDRKNRHWFYDFENQGFWPISFLSTSHIPYCMLNYRPINASQARVLMGCADGYVRGFRREAEHDDGSQINSTVLIGPLKLGGTAYSEGMLLQYHTNIPSWSGNVQVDLYKGNNAELAFLNGRYGSSVTAYANDIRRYNPRLRGGAIYFEFSYGASLRAWGLDTVPILVERMNAPIRKV